MREAHRRAHRLAWAMLVPAGLVGIALVWAAGRPLMPERPGAGAAGSAASAEQGAVP